MPAANGILLVMQNPKAGSETAHRAWYLDHHLSDVCSVPGVLRGEYACADSGAENPRWSTLAAYWLEGDPSMILGEVFRRASSGDWTMSATADTPSTLMAIGEALTGRVLSSLTHDVRPEERQLYIVLTNSTPGDDDTFNAWYNDVHLPDVLAVPGFVAAQRFRLADHPSLGAPPFRYLAIYEVVSADADNAFATLGKRAGTELMVLSPTLDTVNIYALAFTPERLCTSLN